MEGGLYCILIILFILVIRETTDCCDSVLYFSLIFVQKKQKEKPLKKTMEIS